MKELQNRLSVILAIVIVSLSLVYLIPNILLNVPDIAIWFSYIKGMEEHNLILYKDMYEINFPGILIFQYLPYLFGNLIGSEEYMVLFIFELEILIGLSAYLIYRIENKNKLLALVFALLSLLIVLGEFGQRDHLVSILYFPFLLLSINKFHDKDCSHPWIRYVSILFVGLAIYIKPIYLFLYIAIELLFLIKNRKIVHLLEKLLLIFMGILYVSWIFIFFPYFFTNIVPDFSSYLTEFGSHKMSLYLGIAMLLILMGLLFRKKWVEVYIMIVLFIILVIQGHFFVYYYIPYFTLGSFFMLRSRCYVLPSIILLLSLSYNFSFSYQRALLGEVQKNEAISCIENSRNLLYIGGIGRAYPFMLRYSDIIGIGASSTLYINSSVKNRDTPFINKQKKYITDTIKNKKPYCVILVGNVYYERFDKEILKDYNIDEKIDKSYFDNALQEQVDESVLIFKRKNTMEVIK